MPLTTENLTVANVDAEIETTKQEFRKRLRHLRALRRCLADEAEGKQRSVFPEENTETEPK